MLQLQYRNCPQSVTKNATSQRGFDSPFHRARSQCQPGSLPPAPHFWGSAKNLMEDLWEICRLIINASFQNTILIQLTPLSPRISSFFINSGMITSCRERKCGNLLLPNDRTEGKQKKLFRWVSYLHSLLAAVGLQSTAAILRECRHVEIECRRSAFPLLVKTDTISKLNICFWKLPYSNDLQIITVKICKSLLKLYLFYIRKGNGSNDL